MRFQSSSAALAALQQFDRSVCLKWNAIKSVPVLRFFVTVSKLGDGGVWIVLAISLLVVDGAQAWWVVARMSMSTLVGMLVYRSIKRRLARPRPCASDFGVVAWTGPLDLYAFPSGHTLHAVALSVILVRAYPPMVWLLAPLAALIAVSRIVLGLHYPSDVVAGAAVGAALGWTCSIGLS